MTKSVHSLTEGSIAQGMLRFAMPLFLGNLFQQLYYTVDALIVGNFLGSSALAAVSSSSSLIYMLVGFFQGIGSGAGVLVAHAYGSKNQEALHNSVHTTVAAGIAAGILMTVLGVFAAPHLLHWVGTPDSVLPEASTYLRIYFGGAMGLVLYNAFVGIIQAVGDSRHPLYYLIVSSVVNLVLDVVFIAVFHWGVAGAAFATVLSQMISAVLCLILLVRTPETWRVHLRRIRFHGPTFLKILHIGLPAGVQSSIVAFANVLVQSHVNSFGEMAMAAYGASATVQGFVFLPIMSFNTALTTFVGQNLGAKNVDRTRKGARFGILTNVALAQLIGVLVFLSAPVFIRAFNDNPEVIRLGVREVHFESLAFGILALSHSIASILRGAGRTMFPMLVMMVCWCVIRVGFLAIAIPLTHSIDMV